MRGTTLATAQRRRQRTARIENEQVAYAKVIADLIEAGVFDAARRAFDHQQSHLVTTNSATFRRLLRTKLRRKCECEPRAHYSKFTAERAEIAEKNRNQNSFSATSAISVVIFRFR